MNLILLSGNSKRGKQWLNQVDDSLKPLFDRTYCHDYAHWKHDEPEINLDLEIKKLAMFEQSFAPYVIFAKSAGTILASKAIAKGILRPKACLFVGFPLVMAKDHTLPADEWLKMTNSPIVVLQHTADPFGSYNSVKKYLANTQLDNITTNELPGDSHDYLEFQTFKGIAAQLTN